MWLLALLIVSDSARGFDVPIAPAETLRVTEVGAGEPVVLLPGLFGSAFAFRALGPRLAAAGYRPVVVEPLGIGGSARPEHADYSLTAQADRVAAALDRLGITSAVVVAHSIGASIAYRLAYRRPDLVHAVVALEGGPAEAAATPSFRRAMQFASWIKLFGGVRLVRNKIRAQLVRASGDASWISDSVVSGYTAAAATDLDATLKAYVAMARAREPERLEPHLTAIHCPVLLLVGGAPHDGAPGAADIAVLAERLGTFAMDTVPGAGHFLYEERPDAVVSAVDRVSGPAGPLDALLDDGLRGEGHRPRTRDHSPAEATMRIKRPIRTILRVVFRKAPVEAQLIVTRRCNLSCGYCSEYDKVSEFISLDLLKQRIDALHRLHVVNIALLGGEPLMHPDLPEIVAYGDRRAQVSVTTNGFLLTEALVHRLNAAGLANMEVSIDAVRADRTGYIQKCLKTMRPKLVLLRRLAKFDLFINMVLCDQTRREFEEAIHELEELGFPVTIDLLHDARGAIQIKGKEYLDLWKEHYVDRTPQAYLDQDYGSQLLQGRRPAWQCRAGSRFLYVDEFGKVQFCSAQRGRLDKPLADYTRRDLRAHARTYKGCEAGCALLCVYRDSVLDNRPMHTVGSLLRLAWRTVRSGQASGRSFGTDS